MESAPETHGEEAVESAAEVGAVGDRVTSSTHPEGEQQRIDVEQDHDRHQPTQFDREDDEDDPSPGCQHRRVDQDPHRRTARPDDGRVLTGKQRQQQLRDPTRQSGEQVEPEHARLPCRRPLDERAEEVQRDHVEQDVAGVTEAVREDAGHEAQQTDPVEIIEPVP